MSIQALAVATCLFTDCAYTESGGEVSCAPGGSDCTSAFLQTAYKSEFHDSAIRDLTDEVNEKLYKLSRKPPRPGMQLSFLWTQRGVFLAWVEHRDAPPEPPEGQVNVTRESGIEANDAALKLYPHPYHPGF